MTPGQRGVDRRAWDQENGKKKKETGVQRDQGGEIRLPASTRNAHADQGCSRCQDEGGAAREEAQARTARAAGRWRELPKETSMRPSGERASTMNRAASHSNEPCPRTSRDEHVLPGALLPSLQPEFTKRGRIAMPPPRRAIWWCCAGSRLSPHPPCTASLGHR